MKKKNYSKKWIVTYLTAVVCLLGIVALQVTIVDPFFHYHKPDTEKFYYELNNQRSQNDGIIKHFNYDALITGTSMTENFSTTELDELFDTNSIKVPYSGGTYKEINDCVETALQYNPKLKLVVRALDMGKFIESKDALRSDLGQYPTYLYDDNIFNDVEYVFNRDVFFGRTVPMILESAQKNTEGGITSFDSYCRWMGKYSFGKDVISPSGVTIKPSNTVDSLSVEERQMVDDMIEQNVINVAKEYPDVTFYYYFTPYSAVWWGEQLSEGTFYKQVEAEQLIIEKILKYKNIKLFSFNNLTDITLNLNNYKDDSHYASWVNSYILKCMYKGENMITYDNYQAYLDEEIEFYSSFDYNTLNTQEDYENDFYGEALFLERINGIKPYKIPYDVFADGTIKNAEVTKDTNENPQIKCLDCLSKEDIDEQSLEEYLINVNYVGEKIIIEDISPYTYLVFDGQKKEGEGEPSVYIYDMNNEIKKSFTKENEDIDSKKHQYMIDVSGLSGKVQIIFNGGVLDSKKENESGCYLYSNITFY